MRFFTAAAFALASLASLVAAQAKPNPISSPTAGDEIEAGKPVEIKWNPTTSGKITLKLRAGDENALDTVETIVVNTDNEGSYTWTPSKDLPAGADYTIEISSDEGENYSPRFTLESDGKGVTTTKAATTSTVTSTSSISTTTDEAETTTESATATETETSSNTTTTRKPTKTADADEDEDEDEDVPNTNDKSAGYKAASPIALVFCLAMGVVYFN